MNVLLAGAIIFAIGVAILVTFSLDRTVKQQKSSITIMQQPSSPLEYIEPMEQEKEVLSSEKIKLVKEKELARKAEENVLSTDNKQEKTKDEKESADQENNKSSEMLQSFEDVRAGEVQRNGQEQFNLRKDEPPSVIANDSGSWWL